MAQAAGASAELPAVVASQAGHERRHRFIGRSCLHLEVGRLDALALATREHARDPLLAVLQRPVRLDLLHCVLPLRRPLGVLLITRHVLGCQPWDVLGFVEADHELETECRVLGVLEVVEDRARLAHVGILLRLSLGEGLLDLARQHDRVPLPLLALVLVVLPLRLYLLLLPQGLHELLKHLRAVGLHLPVPAALVCAGLRADRLRQRAHGEHRVHPVQLRRGLEAPVLGAGIDGGGVGHLLLGDGVGGGVHPLQRRLQTGIQVRAGFALAVHLPPLLDEPFRLGPDGVVRGRLRERVHRLAYQRVAKHLGRQAAQRTQGLQGLEGGSGRRRVEVQDRLQARNLRRD
mmetsp:Transcript_16093/g.48472  ORF Transcript_16093/g.48472 Transcript_16093/m.48472 type:complete len:347 (-) Transcript_16093:92-1132(-)